MSCALTASKHSPCQTGPDDWNNGLPAYAPYMAFLYCRPMMNNTAIA